MPLPRVRTDFNSNSLANHWTQDDVQRAGLELSDGMRCVFYDLDEQENERGFLHSVGTVWWDAVSKQFRIDMRTLEVKFTPGEQLDVLDKLYMD